MFTQRHSVKPILPTAVYKKQFNEAVFNASGKTGMRYVKLQSPTGIKAVNMTANSSLRSNDSTQRMTDAIEDVPLIHQKIKIKKKKIRRSPIPANQRGAMSPSINFGIMTVTEHMNSDNNLTTKPGLANTSAIIHIES